MSKISFKSVIKSQKPKKKTKKKESKKPLKQVKVKKLKKKDLTPIKEEVKMDQSVVESETNEASIISQVTSKEIKALHEEIHQSDSHGVGEDTLPINKKDTQEIDVEVTGSPEGKSVELTEPEKPPVPKPKTIPLSSIFKIAKGGENQAKVEEEIVEETSEQVEDEEIIEETIEGVVESEQEKREHDHEDLESDQIIAFFLGSEQYGMEILDAREVKRILPLTPIPRTPDWIMGIVNLRGIVFPVVDLKKRLKIETKVGYPLNLRRIIVIEIGETRIGLLVDKINMILNKQLLEYSVPPVLISGGEDFISSIAKQGDMIISIISLSRLFTSEERELLAQIKEEET